MSWILPSPEFLGRGWQGAFWLSANNVLVGYCIRTQVTEGPIFVEPAGPRKVRRFQANEDLEK
jgi:hypothetical protein